MQEFVIEQHQPDQFKIVYTSSRALEPSEVQAIEKAVLTYLDQPVAITVEKVDIMDRSKRGKLKQFISYL